MLNSIRKHSGISATDVLAYKSCSRAGPSLFDLAPRDSVHDSLGFPSVSGGFAFASTLRAC